MKQMRQDNRNSLTEGSLLQTLIRFALPYLLSCFLQTFYGLADLFITGRFFGADTITAVSVGSQIMHMFTVIIVGLVMGITVKLGHAVGAGKRERVSRIIGNSVTLFALFSVVFMVILVLLRSLIVQAVATPVEALKQTKDYLLVCFLGIPLITAYNVISGIFRGLGDSKTPMYFVALAGVINIILDYILIGSMQLGAFGAALATVLAQGCSVLSAWMALLRKHTEIRIVGRNLIPSWNIIKEILLVGCPVAAQDGFIQVSFLVITAIANSRGLEVAAAVGIVEKLICFFFLVPSAMLSSVSAITAQNVGAKQYQRGRLVLRYGILISSVFGLCIAAICQLAAADMLQLFAKGEPEVILLGGQYLRSYIFDCLLAGIHFCYSGYFCAYGKAHFSFIHNVLSVLLIRIPGAYLASVCFPETLYPMGWAPAIGSLFSVVLCIIFYHTLQKQGKHK